MSHVDSQPYPWPYNGDLRAANTALIIIEPLLKSEWVS